MGAQCGEGFLRTDRLTLGDHAFGLLDDNAAIEGVIELIVEDLSLESGAELKDGDGGGIRKCLRALHIEWSHFALFEVEQVEGGRALGITGIQQSNEVRMSEASEKFDLNGKAGLVAVRGFA